MCAVILLVIDRNNFLSLHFAFAGNDWIWNTKKGEVRIELNWICLFVCLFFFASFWFGAWNCFCLWRSHSACEAYGTQRMLESRTWLFFHWNLALCNTLCTRAVCENDELCKCHRKYRIKARKSRNWTEPNGYYIYYSLYSGYCSRWWAVTFF